MRPLRLVALLFLIVGVSGCASTAPPRVAGSGQPIAALPDRLQQFLSEAAAGASAAFADSPWGADVVITVNPPYHAASGRICRHLEIASSSTTRPGLSCRTDNGAWEPVRVLHHQGRPWLVERTQSGSEQ